MDDESKKAQEAAEGLALFLSQFGEADEYNTLLLQILFEEMLLHQSSKL